MERRFLGMSRAFEQMFDIVVCTGSRARQFINNPHVRGVNVRAWL